MEKIKVLSVNISVKKGIIKTPVASVILNEDGTKGDAHSGPWNRQVSLLGIESIKKFENQAGRKINYGEFAENITTEGMELFQTKPLDRFIIGDLILEVTQIGKECHGDSCAIFKEVGNCVMPKEGIFCRVIQEGNLKAGDVLDYQPKIFKIKIITLSDRASKRIYEDKSGPRLKSLIEDYFKKMSWKFEIHSHIIPDDPVQLNNILKLAGKEKSDLIFTTGGTGIGPKDLTPDVVKPMLDKEIPGIMEMIRVKYGMEKPNALISRAVAGIMGNTLVFTLPGSVKAVNEYLTEILKGLKHLVYMLHGLDMH
ncbi:molybdenum cofactor synthesis domain-containing protein [candidate division KSB1 bacterium]